jgi:hypothetical protein
MSQHLKLLQEKRDIISAKSSMNCFSKINNESKMLIQKKILTNIDKINEKGINIDKIHKKGIYIINNVYQSNYNNKINCPGLGDFIRGCYFILEFCNKYNFKPRIIFNNIISKFLNIKILKIGLFKNILNGVNYFQKNNVKNYNIQNKIIFEPMKDSQNTDTEFIDCILNTTPYNGNVFICCNSFPNDNISEKILNI